MEKKNHKNILHLSYDIGWNDRTAAVRNLINTLQDYSIAQIIALRRVFNRKDEKIESCKDGMLYIKCYGLPYGFFLLRHLKRVYKKILFSNSSELIDLKSVDVIHAHKLTYEGYIGFLLAEQFECQLIISLRQTDTYVLKYRPDLIPLMKKIIKFSKSIFYITPYMITDLESLFGKCFFAMEVRHKLFFLPNIINRMDFNPKMNNHYFKYFFTAFHMGSNKSVKNKNVENLFKAMKRNIDDGHKLLIAGDGPYLINLKRLACYYKIDHKLVFLGAVPNYEMDMYYAKSVGFVLPSFRETFGMVYAEALINGTPILYSKGTGFDGLFENVGVSVDPHSVDSIADGMRNLIKYGSFYRTMINNLARKNAFHIFSPQHAKNIYLKALSNLSLSVR